MNVKRYNSTRGLKLVLVALFVSVGLISKAQATKGIAVVNGTWERGTNDYVAMFKIVDGKMEEMTKANLPADKSFALAVQVSGEGMYVLGFGTTMQTDNKYPVYLKPGDVVNLAVNDTSYTLVGENTLENRALESWHNFVYPLELKSRYALYKRGAFSTYVDFFPMVEAKAKELKSFKYKKTKNPAFESAFEEYRELDFLSLAVGYNYKPRQAHPEGEDFTDYFKQLELDELTSTTKLFNYPFGSRLIRQLFMVTQKAQGRSKDEDYHAVIKNDTLIGEMSLETTRNLKSYKAYLVFEAQEKKYMLTDGQKARLEALKTSLAQVKTEGQMAVDFKYPDVKGDMVSLSDLKGKVVVIDVWATWCGPCKQQIPHLKQLEKAYHGKDVEFLSVSIDAEKDREKWANFVKEQELGGIQLFADGWGSDIAKYYNIKGIPRFMVVDKEGRLVSVDAPRPSNPNLKAMIDEQLNN